MKKISLSITQKLLLSIIPLVCIPIIGVGFFSYNASVNSMTQVLKDEQLLKAKVAASAINDIFQMSLQDLKTMLNWDLVSQSSNYDFSTDEFKKEDQILLIKELFRNFSIRSPYYDAISLHYFSTGKTISVSKDGRVRESASGFLKFVKDILDNNEKPLNISKAYYSDSRQKYLIHVGLGIRNRRNQISRALVIDLDFSKLIKSILAIKVGKEGFAFLVDEFGRTIAHPNFQPYEYDFTKYDDPRLREFIVDMISGETGWKRYFHFKEQAAAIAPVSIPHWSLAVTVPIEEFKSEANNLRSIVIQSVVLILIVAVIVISFISYRIVNPIQRLVTATQEVAKGELLQEIPVTSGGELGELTHSFNTMIRSLRSTQFELIRSEKLISMGKLSAGVAHEIRNPLNAMKGAITYLKKHQGDNPIIGEYSQLILEEINRLSQFVTEFLHFAKLSVPKPVLTDINELIENTLNLYKEEFKNKEISVYKRLQRSLPKISVDIKQIEQVLVNVFVNALDSLQHAGNIDISSYYQKQMIWFSHQPTIIIKIADNGSGIHKDHLKNIFDPFFSTKENGTGLGLPISLNIIENHGGTIKLSSEKGKGTEVLVILPVEGNLTG